MKPLPPALLSPPDGRYSVDDALTIWLHVYHGLPYDAPMNTLAARRARQAAGKTLAPIIRYTKRHCVTGIVEPSTEAERRQRRINALLWDGQTTDWIDEAHVDAADLVALAREHGVDMAALAVEPVAAAPTEIPARQRGGKDVNGPAMAAAIELMKESPIDQIDACRRVVEQYFPELSDVPADSEHERAGKADLRESKAKSISSRITAQKGKQKRKR